MTHIEAPNDGGQLARLIAALAWYQEAVQRGEAGEAAGAAWRASQDARRLFNQALLAADADPNRSRSQLAEEMGLIGPWPNKRLAHYINRAKADLTGDGSDDSKTGE